MINTLANVNEWNTLTAMAKTFIDSGLLPQSIKKPEAALLIMWQGRELGIDPLQALNTINVIAGKPTVSPQLMLALIRRSGQLEDMQIDVNDERAVVTMKRKGESPFTTTFSMADARKMSTTEWENNTKKTISLADKYNWKSMPKIMMQWRAVAAAARVVFPDVILGLYTPEEMGADVVATDDGDMTVIQPVEPPLKALPPTTNGNGHSAVSPTVQIVEDELARDQGVSSMLEEEIVFCNRVRLEPTLDNKSWYALFFDTDKEAEYEWHDLNAIKALFPECKEWHKAATAAWKAEQRAEAVVIVGYHTRMIVHGNRVLSATKIELAF